MVISDQEKKLKLKELRQNTKASIKECYDALIKAKYDLPLSYSFLKARMEEISEKKNEREAKSGVFGSYSHCDGKVLGIVELLSETDFVSKSPEFKELAKNLATQVVFSNDVKYVSDDEALSKEEKRLSEAELNIFVLLRQAYFKNSLKNVKETLSEFSAKFGEKLEIRSIYRFSI